MKKFIIILFTIIALCAGVIAAIPVVLKDDIFIEVKKIIDENVNADIELEKDDIELSLIKTFPELRISIQNFSITNRAPFDGVKLIEAEKFAVNMNLLSVLLRKIEFSSINIINPYINVIITEDGKANYDIAIKKDEDNDESKKEKQDDTQVDDGETDFSVRINHWSIKSGHITYNDNSTDTRAILNKFDHTGSGDFTLTIFDLATETKIDKTHVSYQGTEYLEGRSLSIKSTLGMDLDKMHFDIKKSTLAINQLLFTLAGTFDMPKSDDNDSPIDVDLRFATPTQGIKPLLSLIPSTFQNKDYNIMTKGSLSISCLVKGKIAENELPSVKLNMKIDDGEIGYHQLPERIKNLGVDLHLDIKKMLPKNAKINFKKIYMKIGDNPINGKMYLENLDKPYVDALLNGHLNLSALSKTIPMDSMSVKGTLDMKLKLLGTYDTLARKIPQIKLDLNLKNGLIKHDTLDLAIEKINIKGEMHNDTGRMKDTTIVVSNFGFAIQGEKINGRIKLWNMDNYHWDYFIKGSTDLKKIQTALALKEMDLKGIVNVNVLGRGDIKSLENKNYRKIVNNGNVNIKDFYFSSVDTPQTITMNAIMKMDEKGINLVNAKGKLGNSPYVSNGWIRNYLPYLLSKNGVLKGNLNFNSNDFNVNKWLIDAKEEKDKEEKDELIDESENNENEVFIVPKNLDLTLNSKIQKISYDDMIMTNMNGILKVINGKLKMEHLKFNVFQGHVDMSGEYNTIMPKIPKYKFNFIAKNLRVKEAYNSIEVINKLVPIAESINGDFSTNFNIKGNILEDMTPDLETMYGKGIVELKQISVDRKAPVVKILTEQLKFLGQQSLTLKNIKTETIIENGIIETKPFDVGFSGRSARVYGKTNLAGNIDYVIDFNLPYSILSSLTKLGSTSPSSSFLASQKVILPVKITGTYSRPSLKLGKPKLERQTKQAISKEVNKQVKSKLKELGVNNKDSINKILNSKDPAKEIEKKADKLKKMLGF